MNSQSYIIVTVLLVINTGLAAQPHNWQRTNPGGGGAYSTIGAGPTGIVLAGSDLSGAYRSLNGGQSWDVIGSERGLTTTHVSGVGFHPTNGDILFLGTDDGVFRSTDGGGTVSQALVGGYITDVEIARSNTSIGYAAYHPQWDSSNGAVFKTTNGGLSWSQSSTDLPNGLRVLKLLIHPTDENMVWLLSGQGRFACGPAQVWRSSNGGVNWTQQASGLGEILDLGMDLENDPYLFLTTMNAGCNEPYYWTDLDGAMYRSIDLGTTWTATDNLTGVVWVNTSQPDNIRLIDPREPFPWISGAGTWQSLDGGYSWAQSGFIDDWDYGYQNSAFWSYQPSFNGICKTLGDDLSDPNTIYWTNFQWVFNSTDGGQNFENCHTTEVSPGWWQSTGFDNIVMMDMAISEVNPDIVYLGLWDMGLWRSIDNGGSWQSCNNVAFSGTWDGYGGNTSSVLADPDRELTVWATMSGTMAGSEPVFLVRSDSGGEKTSWVQSDSGLPSEEIIGLSIDRQSPANNRTLFVTALGDVYKSTNDGYNWTKVLDCNGCRFTAVDHFNGNLLYAGGENGLWRSTDGGSNWSDIGLAAMEGDSNIGLWDWGWEGVYEVKADPHLANTLYVAAHGSGKGLWRSNDMGNSWEKLLTDDFLRGMAISPQEGDVLYATSSSAFHAGGYDPNSNGVLFSDDGGSTWTEANDNMAWKFGLVAEVSKSGWVYIGSPGTGFQKAQVPGTTDAHIFTTPDAIDIYPNPFSDKVILDGDFSGFEIKIFDAAGLEVADYTGSSNPLTIDLNGLGPGLYFVSVQHSVLPPLGVYKIIKQ